MFYISLSVSFVFSLLKYFRQSSVSTLHVETINQVFILTCQFSNVSNCHFFVFFIRRWNAFTCIRDNQTAGHVLHYSFTTLLPEAYDIRDIKNL